MADVLDQAALDAALADLPDWHGDPSGIRREVTAPSYPAGIALVNAVAEVAEELGHHPDIDIRWTTVTFALTTHVAGGVTDADLALARRIDALVAAQ
ncbi:MAG TPA: 4a-hydroxytetrahydrobiopterin dehydratase [Cryptosporangiaceae bacterium]|nr:4a-hydroxytetrahydrobiopterin dehydratase [Cryptosporangiaceae bacterium]